MPAAIFMFWFLFIYSQCGLGNLPPEIRGKPDWWTANENADVVQFLPSYFIHRVSVRSVRSLTTSWASSDQSKLQFIHFSAKVTHPWTSQTSPGWVTSSVWPCPDPSTSVLRISSSEALKWTVRDAHKGNSGVIVWSVLLNCSSSPIKGTFFFYILFHLFFFLVLFIIILQRWNLILIFFFFSLRGFSVKHKLGSGLSWLQTQELHIALSRHWIHTEDDERIQSSCVDVEFIMFYCLIVIVWRDICSMATKPYIVHYTYLLYNQ